MKKLSNWLASLATGVALTLWTPSIWNATDDTTSKVSSIVENNETKEMQKFRERFEKTTSKISDLKSKYYDGDKIFFYGLSNPNNTYIIDTFSDKYDEDMENSTNTIGIKKLYNSDTQLSFHDLEEKLKNEIFYNYKDFFVDEKHLVLQNWQIYLKDKFLGKDNDEHDWFERKLSPIEWNKILNDINILLDRAQKWSQKEINKEEMIINTINDFSEKLTNCSDIGCLKLINKDLEKVKKDLPKLDYQELIDIRDDKKKQILLQEEVNKGKKWVHWIKTWAKKEINW